MRLSQARLLVSMIASSMLLSACALQQDVASAPPSGKTGSSAPALSATTVDGKALTVAFRNHRTVPSFGHHGAVRAGTSSHT